MGHCLELFNFQKRYNVIRFEFHKNKYVIDLDCFFQDFFDQRDNQLGKPRDYVRYETTGEVTTYHFKIEELIEAFLWNYSPNEFAGFLEENLTEDTMQSEVLVDLVRRTYKDYKIAFFGSGTGQIGAINFPVEEIAQRLPESYFTGVKYDQKTIIWDEGGNIFGKDRFPASPSISWRKTKAIRKRLAENDDPILVLSTHEGPKLHPANIAVHYEFPLEDYELIKKTL
ncbi:MAG: hypothetical protein V3V78_02930 [Candidatus Woesearchaeota archaeon]